ncbi:hypothetical protein [Gramella sp. AN32]|uniref:Thrombospondin n=1 Tax=Christiangramia antarctica TaxID=2058158 RepID=A0ABW5X5U3_9FLAO|nr:hypothetical protein [Gramella sp. AN32]MCM4158003.1 hypothetical protein [Gramella sp. AN32]
MKRFLAAFFAITFMLSCDDGEITVTNFDFEDSTFKFCQGTNKNVIYAVNSDETNESISLEFSNVSGITIDEDGNFTLADGQESVSFALTGNNRIVYRIYEDALPANYFCQVVPPSNVTIVEEWLSGTGAVVTITSNFTDETADADADGDGIKNINEGWNSSGTGHLDTDGDGIPDYLDIDDDNDNVITKSETKANTGEPITDDGYLDTDEDGIPNYLDNDDDNDGVPTRLEVTETAQDSPVSFSSTGDGVSNYLNPEQTSSFQHDLYRSHDITRNYGYTINVTNLLLQKQQGDMETIQYTNYRFGNLQETNVDFPQCPVIEGVILPCSDDTTEEPDTTDETGTEN